MSLEGELNRKFKQAMHIETPSDQGNIFSAVIENRINLDGCTLEEAVEELMDDILKNEKDPSKYIEMLVEAAEAVRSQQNRN